MYLSIWISTLQNQFIFLMSLQPCQKYRLVVQCNLPTEFKIEAKNAENNLIV